MSVDSFTSIRINNKYEVLFVYNEPYIYDEGVDDTETIVQRCNSTRCAFCCAMSVSL